MEREIAAVRRDVMKAAATLSAQEARYLVDTYYQMQRNRIRAGNQLRALSEAGEPHGTIQWFLDRAKELEKEVETALDAYSASQPLGQWARAQKGIGPIIAAGLLAHIDLTKAQTAGAIWRYAGLDPTATWNRKEKRPWNASLKTLCWKIGESFVKVSGKQDAFYGRIWRERKEYEEARNERGDNRDLALSLAGKVGKSTEAYKAYSIGKLPPGHIHARAKRYAVKLFLAHYFEVGRRMLGLPVPVPYPIAQLGHAKVIAAPRGD